MSSDGETRRERSHLVGLLVQAMDLRKKYMRVSLQNKKWQKYVPEEEIRAGLGGDGMYKLEKDSMVIPSAEEFYHDMEYLNRITHYGPLKSYCFQRLEHLELQFKLHHNTSSAKEKKEQKTASSKDIYTVVKADTHIHHSASMNSKKLLQFIKKKLREEPNEVVYKDGEEQTLQNIFQRINKTPDTLCLDSLDTHSNIDTFHRFDRFNSKYNPYGVPLLREVFLKHDNYIGGKYLAEITKELIEEIEEKEYLKCEWGISIYGKKPDEARILSDWIKRFDIHSPSIRWYIQVPRLYGLFKGYGQIKSFQEFLSNIFGSLLEVSQDQAKNSIGTFLLDVVGFDSVDDESVKNKRSELEKEPPAKWKHKDNPPYTYYMYHMFYHVAMLNRIRAARGLNIFSFRPHAGESGETEHLAAAFLLSRSIAHGVKLRKAPVLQYLYYLAQVGIAMSPLSNNSLFIEYRKNPFPQFFYRGLNVSLSTDDPLQFHYTREPLMEEYSIAAQIWKLSSCDQCEIARNSVLISSFPDKDKEEWLGQYAIEGRLVNDPKKTNIPPTRFRYRAEQLTKEYHLLHRHIGSRHN
ncbi:AMP deaminase [Nematocida homosporus]|uniref:AMP deaminase n=1 Tax=Nematocida homosporus TaxID=1912981 RepID=UPI00221FAAB0|nr:AMP deaminase [Nematocida homosporus]KAI5185618.1 AMP deaminase [Nematocida homosporus]